MRTPYPTVLIAVRVSSENAAELQPAIETTITEFGSPVATMRDPGRAGAKAIAGCQLEAVPDLVCHFHFLAIWLISVTLVTASEGKTLPTYIVMGSMPPANIVLILEASVTISG